VIPEDGRDRVSLTVWIGQGHPTVIFTGPAQ